MRKLLILFLLALFAGGAYAQSDSSYSLNKDIRKMITTKDSVKNQVLNITYCWNSSTNTWIKTDQCERSYNSQKNITKNEYFKWNEFTNDLVEGYKYEIQYDENGKKEINTVNYKWDTSKNYWKFTYKSYCYHDVCGKDSLCMSYQWNDSTKIWIHSSKRETGYDSQKKPILWLNHKWNRITNNWIKDEKTEAIRDKNGNPLSFAHYVGDSINNTWKGNYKTEYEYDKKGKENLIRYYNWKKEKNDWEEWRESRYKYWYNSTDSIIKKLEQSRWVKNTKKWGGNNEFEYIYGEDGTKTFKNREYQTIYDKKRNPIFSMNYSEWNHYVDAFIPNYISATYNKDFLENPFLLVYPSVGMQSVPVTFYAVDIPNSTNGEWKYAVNNKWKYKGNSKRVYESFSPKETGKALKINNLSDVFIIYECDYKGKHYTSNTIIIAPTNK